MNNGSPPAREPARPSPAPPATDLAPAVSDNPRAAAPLIESCFADALQRVLRDVLMSRDIDQIAPGYVAALAEIGAAAHDSHNPFDKYTYATLDSIKSACQPALAKHGIGVVQSPSFDGHVVTVTTLLLHTSGQFIGGKLMIPIVEDKRGLTPQKVGSAITYGRKYGLAALCGVTMDGDDDGQGAASSAARARDSRDSGATPKRRLNGSDNGPPRRESQSDVEAILAAFAGIGVSQNELEAFIGKPASEWTQSDRKERLQPRYYAVKDRGEPLDPKADMESFYGESLAQPTLPTPTTAPATEDHAPPPAAPQKRIF